MDLEGSENNERGEERQPRLRSSALGGSVLGGVVVGSCVARSRTAGLSGGGGGARAAEVDALRTGADDVELRDGAVVVERVGVPRLAEQVGDVADVPAVGFHEWVGVDECLDGAVG